MAVWMQNGCKRINYLASWPCGSQGATAHGNCPTSWASYCSITGLGKDQSSKNSFYWMHITFTPSKSKNCKLNHHSVTNGLYSVLGTILNAFHALTYSILTTELLLLLSHFSRVRLCATPQTVAHQAPPSLGFSRQERWSGLPFPSPMHQSEKSKWSRSVMSNPQRPHGLQPSRLLRPWDFPGKSTGVGCHCLLLQQN